MKFNTSITNFYCWLKEKYLPSFHMKQIHEQYMNLRHMRYATIVVEYMSRFDKLTIRCDIRKNLIELYGLAFVFESASVGLP